MRSTHLILAIFTFLTTVSSTNASVVLNVKIAQMINNQIVEVTKKYSAEYNKDILINEDGLKNNLVLRLKKFSNILVNGNKLNPVQVDLKVLNDMKQIIGKTQTITSFYQGQMNFEAKSDLSNATPDLNVSLTVEESN